MFLTNVYDLSKDFNYMKSTESFDILFETVDIETVNKTLAEDSKDASDGIDKGLELKSVKFDYTDPKIELKSSKKFKKQKNKKLKWK